jgi:hypothetical protein
MFDHTDDATKELVELPAAFVRLAFVDGQPAIVRRAPSDVLVTERVPSHSPYKRALARDVRRRHQGAIDQLAAYDADQAANHPPAVPASR